MALLPFTVRATRDQDAVVAVDPAALAQHGAVGLVAVDRGILHVHRAVEGIDPAAVGPFTPLAWLALTVQLVSDRVLFSQSIPPPRAVPVELTWLLLMTESVIVTLPPVVLMPPPSDVAWLLMMLLEATFSVPWLEMPPPCDGGVAADGAVGQRGRAARSRCPGRRRSPLAELPLTVQLVSVVVPP